MGCTASRVPMVPRPPSLGSDDSPSEAEAEEEAKVRKGETSKPDNAMETNFDAAAAGTVHVDAQVGAAEAPSTMDGATLGSTTSEEGVDARAAVVVNHRADASVDDNDNVNNGNAVETSNAKVEAALPAAASSTDATSDAVAGEAGAICAVNKGGAPLRFMSLETLALPTPEGEGRTLKSTPGGRDGGRANAGPLSLRAEKAAASKATVDGINPKLQIQSPSPAPTQETLAPAPEPEPALAPAPAPA